jgi:hypothetical protein
MAPQSSFDIGTASVVMFLGFYLSVFLCYMHLYVSAEDGCALRRTELSVEVVSSYRK